MVWEHTALHLGRSPDGRQASPLIYACFGAIYGAVSKPLGLLRKLRTSNGCKAVRPGPSNLLVQGQGHCKA